MKVNIAGFVYEYISDYDPVNTQENVARNWRVSAGDYFKFPVKIGSVLCFVKRFAKASNEISGFHFLMKIKGTKQTGLPEVYDVVLTKEDKKDTFYLFTEYIQGDTLDVLQRKGFSFVPEKFSKDLFYAFNSIHKYQYWFPDFDPKNFLRNNKGDFYLIDLDSTYPVSTLPQASMFGSKDFWSPVFNFYRSKGFDSSRIKTLRGDTLNTLQLIYLLALYSFYLFSDGEDLSPESIERLNQYLTQKHKLFDSTMKYCFYQSLPHNAVSQRPLTYNVFSSFVANCLFSKITESHFISSTFKNQQLLVPVIRFGLEEKKTYFTVGDSYTLSWKVQNTTSVFLDDRLVAPADTIKLNANNSLRHTLKAVNEKNGTVRVNNAIVNIAVDAKPEINFTVSETKVKSGQTIQLQWQVKNGKDITIYQDGVSVASNQPLSGSMELKLTLTNNKESPQKSVFVLNALTKSGAGVYRSVPDKSVIVEKSGVSVGVMISFAIFLLVVTILISKTCNSERSYTDINDSSVIASTVIPDTSASLSDTSAAFVKPIPTVDSTIADSTTTVESEYGFTDEFTNNLADWPLQSDELVEADITNGTITVTLKTDTVWNLLKSFSVNFEQNFSVSANMGWSEGEDSSSNSFGLLFHNDSANGAWHYYAIKPDGNYGIYILQNSIWTAEAEGWSPYINKGSYYNNVTVEKEDQNVLFYVNGYKLKTLILDEPLGNNIGLRLEGNPSTVMFDNFKIQGNKRT